MGMGRAEQTGRGTGAASGQEVGGRSAGMPPVVICGWAGGPEGRASAHFLVDGKEFTESGRNPRKALISGVSTRRRSGRAANTVLPEQSPNRRENPRIRPCS